MMLLKEEIKRAINAIVEGVNQAVEGVAVGEDQSLHVYRIQALNLPEELTNYLKTRLVGEAENYWDFINLLGELVRKTESKSALASLLQLRLTDLLKWQLTKPHTQLFNLIGVCVRASRDAHYYGVTLDVCGGFRDALLLSKDEDPTYWLQQAQCRLD
ncbi:hypothetical protein BH10CYA1_BH10CYA1_32370 [soil metagenome]